MTFDEWWEKVGSKELTSIAAPNRKYMMRLAWDAALANAHQTMKCDACGYPCHNDGRCTRTQCYNSE